MRAYSFQAVIGSPLDGIARFVRRCAQKLEAELQFLRRWLALKEILVGLR